MFALIITIISIALVAALALATIYYGGTAFNRNSTEIKAAEIMLQQQQIRAAISLYKADHEGAAPQNLQTLITSNYLRQVPAYAFTPPDPSLLPTAHAAEAIPWVMPAEFTATFVLAENVSALVCAEVNFKTRAFRGVPNQLYTSMLPVQCYYSESKQTNIVVVSDDISTVSNAITGVGITPTDPAKPFSLPPTELNTVATTIDPANPAQWKNPPSEFATGGTGSTGGTGGTGASSFNVNIACSQCSTTTEDLSAQSSFSRVITVSLQNITAARAVEFALPITSNTTFSVSCINSTAMNCDPSNPASILLTPDEGASASVDLEITFSPTSNDPVTYSLTSPFTDANNTDNALSATTNVANYIPPNEGDLGAWCASGANDCIAQGSTTTPFARNFAINATGFSSTIASTTVQLIYSDLYYNTPTITCAPSAHYSCSVDLGSKQVIISNWDTQAAPSVPFTVLFDPNGTAQSSGMEARYGIFDIMTSATDLSSKTNKKIFLPLDI